MAWTRATRDARCATGSRAGLHPREVTRTPTFRLPRSLLAVCSDPRLNRSASLGLRGSERFAWLDFIGPRLTRLAFLTTLIGMQKWLVLARPEIIFGCICALVHSTGHLLIHCSCFLPFGVLEAVRSIRDSRQEHRRPFVDPLRSLASRSARDPLDPVAAVLTGAASVRASPPLWSHLMRRRSSTSACSFR